MHHHKYRSCLFTIHFRSHTVNLIILIISKTKKVCIPILSHIRRGVRKLSENLLIKNKEKRVFLNYNEILFSSMLIFYKQKHHIGLIAQIKQSAMYLF